MPRVKKEGPQDIGDNEALVSVRKRGGSRRPIVVVTGPGSQLRNISDLKANPHNVRVHDQKQIDTLANAIRDVGFRGYVIIDENDVILKGHGTVMAAKQLGMLQVPTLKYDDMTEIVKRKFMIFDNQLGLMSAWGDAFVPELIDLAKEGVNIDTFGFENDIIKSVLETEISLPMMDDVTVPGAVVNPVLDGEEDGASDEDAFERNSLSADEMVPHPAEGKNYHQQPPDGSSKAIKSSEERVFLAISLNRDEHDRWLEYRASVRAKSDKQAFEIRMGWREMDPVLPPKTEETTE